MDRKSLRESLAWEMATAAQRRILEWLDRERPWEVLQIKRWDDRSLIVVDCYCMDHRVTCRPDGRMEIVWEEDAQCSA